MTQRWRRQVRRWTAIRTLKSPTSRDLRWIFKYYMRPYNDGWYGSIFEPKKGRWRGRSHRPTRPSSEDRVAHVHELVPEAKLIFMMRNPIERAWSQTVMSFDKAEKGSAESVSEERAAQGVRAQQHRGC